MANSEHQGFIRLGTSQLGADLFVDTAMSRDSLINNAQHALDESTQVRAGWVSHSSSIYLESVDPADTPQYMTSVHFPYTIRPDGTGARMVCRLFGKVVTGGETATWYLHLLPHAYPRMYPYDDADWVSTVQHTSTTNTWKDTSATTIAMNPLAIEDARYGYPVPQSLSGSLEEGETMLARLDIYVTTTNGVARLSGWYVREYIGT